jgi:2-haloacid dehalogenase
MGQARLANIKACVFDAYGTLFDVNSAAAACKAALGERWLGFADAWRQKQLAYTWLRSAMGHYADFWQVTGDALDFTLETFAVRDPALRRRLMDLYLELSAYPEVPEVLAALRRGGFRIAILSNGSPDMLARAVKNAAIDRQIDAIYSVHAIGIFKPDPRVYRLATDGLGLKPEQIAFQSSNAWDAHAAKAFGMRSVWCNRAGQASERLPGTPDAMVRTLAEVPALVGAAA